MVFFSMNSDELLSRTAQYQIQYLPPIRPARHVTEREYRVPHSIYSVRHDEDGNPVARVQTRTRRQYTVGIEDEENVREAHLPPEFSVSRPPFNVTTECSDDDSDDGTAAIGNVSEFSMRRRRTPNRIGSLPFESDSSDDDDSPWTIDPPVADNTTLRRAHSSHRHSADSMTLAEAAEASQLATQEAVRAVGGELMAPYAKFFIEKDKSKCTIRFEPPVTTRFILLKMWSPHHDPGGNIDIQAVLARGFAGPRYVPAVEMR
jgi:hypothetical protein